MPIFGVCFILYYLNLSRKNAFWSNLRNTDSNVNRAAKLYQKCLQKYMKARHDVISIIVLLFHLFHLRKKFYCFYYLFL